RQLAGRAGAALLAALGVPLSRHTSLRTLLRIPLPGVTVPQVLGVDLSGVLSHPSVTSASVALAGVFARQRVDIQGPTLTSATSA
ncbi:MAG: hypothetical protein ACHP9Z_34510, partial [Streptosporangiales bacterium]